MIILKQFAVDKPQHSTTIGEKVRTNEQHLINPNLNPTISVNHLQKQLFEDNIGGSENTW